MLVPGSMWVPPHFYILVYVYSVTTTTPTRNWGLLLQLSV